MCQSRCDSELKMNVHCGFVRVRVLMFILLLVTCGRLHMHIVMLVETSEQINNISRRYKISESLLLFLSSSQRCVGIQGTH